MDCKQFCDLNSKLFKELCDCFTISNTHFIRTTDDEHKQVVHKVWNELDKKGFIYKTNYNGWYSISDETFISNKQVKKIDEYRSKLVNLINQQQDSNVNEADDEQDKIKNPIELLKFLDMQLSKADKDQNELRIDFKTGNLLEYSLESNYIFKLDNVKDRLISLIKDNEQFITPDQFRNILLNMIESDSLNDVSISRAKSRFSWGITVPNDNEQIVCLLFSFLKI